jgi:hypothetical protein
MLKFSVGGTCSSDLNETDGLSRLSTQGLRPSRTVGESVGVIFERTLLIGGTGFDTMYSIPDPTLSFGYA